MEVNVMTDFQMRAIFNMVANKIGNIRSMEDVQDVYEEFKNLAMGGTEFTTEKFPEELKKKQEDR